MPKLPFLQFGQERAQCFKLPLLPTTTFLLFTSTQQSTMDLLIETVTVFQPSILVIVPWARIDAGRTATLAVILAAAILAPS